MSPAHPSFVVDAMLGKLSKWLRILGYDTLYARSDDRGLIMSAIRDGRVLLTSDVDLFREAMKCRAEALLIRSSRLTDMLADVANYIERTRGIRASDFLTPKSTRCTVCNGELVEDQDERYRCTSCGKHYWQGSHWRNIERTFSAARSIAQERVARKVY
ncbi:MAG: Mut7-C RNAse domain-containing protein [Aigarchaeota archaeon]|nr:Mut7-C RNAse domain-containing protein [Aigarchaeota archaeon]MDW8093127.1 Mut7-C RNAse domain-containing protein [Nitrososphaerota archaeon]